MTRFILSVVAVALSGISCRGDDVAGPTNELASAAMHDLSFRQLSVGTGGQICGVTFADLAYCWGSGTSGELGHGRFTNSVRPVAVVGGIKFREVSAGFLNTCAIALDRRVYCWGAHGNVLGTGEQDARATPAPIAGGLRFLKLDVGVLNACGVTTTNRVYCWGDNFYGMIGDGTTLPRPTPVPVAGGHSFISVVVGKGHTCAITTANRAFCWGTNDFGKLGTGSAADRSLVPVPVAGTNSFRQLSSSWDHTCGVTLANRAFCWGPNATGLLGDGTRSERRTPTAVAGGRSIAVVRAGADNFSCALAIGGQAYCWGDNQFGQLGNGRTNEALVPVAVAGGLTFKQLSSGGFQTCAATAAGRGYCWGITSDGEAHTRPTPIPSPM